MSRLAPTLENGKTLIPYFTFGDPGIAESEELAIEAAKAGADIIEWGMPFSDPIADGPVIQASHSRALANTPDISIDQLFESALRVGQVVDTPIILMIATNLVYQYGIDDFFKHANASNISGVIIPDLLFEESDEYRAAAQTNNIDWIPLLSPVSSEERLKTIAKSATGFVYLVSVLGTTGVRNTLSDTLGDLVDKVRVYNKIPVAVGFGISQKEHVRQVWNMCEGAIVGTALVKTLDDGNFESAKAQILASIRDWVTLR